MRNFRGGTEGPSACFVVIFSISKNIFWKSMSRHNFLTEWNHSIQFLGEVRRGCGGGKVFAMASPSPVSFVYGDGFAIGRLPNRVCGVGTSVGSKWELFEKCMSVVVMQQSNKKYCRFFCLIVVTTKNMYFSKMFVLVVLDREWVVKNMFVNNWMFLYFVCNFFLYILNQNNYMYVCFPRPFPQNHCLKMI